MSSGASYIVEALLAGRDCAGNIQFEVTPMIIPTERFGSENLERFELLESQDQARLGSLQIRGYKKGQVPRWDDQISELILQKSLRLPRLQTIHGVEDRLWRDVDYGLRKKHDPNVPRRALASYLLFIQDTKPMVKAENPTWTSRDVSVEVERQWSTISKNRKQSYHRRHCIDLARYYKQLEEYNAGKPVPKIGPNEAIELHEEYLRTGTLVKGRHGIRLLNEAVAEGTPVDPAVLENAMKVHHEKEEHDVRVAEERRLLSEGPSYDWIVIEETNKGE